jgi:hypothetical protein
LASSLGSGFNSARTTGICLGASMPSRTCPPSSRTTVMQISFPMYSFSMSLRVKTSMMRRLLGVIGPNPLSFEVSDFSTKAVRMALEARIGQDLERDPME